MRVPERLPEPSTRYLEWHQAYTPKSSGVPSPDKHTCLGLPITDVLRRDHFFSGNRMASFGSWMTERIVSAIFSISFVPPERVIFVVIDDSHMMKIERHVRLVGLEANEDDRFMKGVSEVKLIKHVGVADCKLCQQDASGGNAPPNLVNKFACAVEVGVSTVGL
jgi:hypothetical protein